MINVLECGAAADGGTDDTAAFQQAIEQAKASGDKVFVPAGKYLIGGQLEGLDNVFLEGVASNKQYWSENDDFSRGASVLVGTGANVLFAGNVTRATIDNICFTGFSKVAEKTSPRSMRFRNCSFKNMVVLDAPSGEEGAYHNFRFFGCDFTNYGIDATFKGRIIDSVWKDCTFVGAAGMDLVQAKANLISQNRFEWIDRSFAIAMYACEYNQIMENFFDRVCGNALLLKQKNKHIHVSENLFNRCGSGLKSDGSPHEPALPERGLAFIQVYGELENVTIQNNVFCKGTSGDRGGEEAPKYVLSKEPHATGCRFTFKGNLTDCAYTRSLLYVEEGAYHKMSVETDAVFPVLTPDVVDLARVSSGPILVHNRAEVKVAEIPQQLLVYNTGGSITLEDGGSQSGIVYGGRVNGRARYSRAEVLYESTELCCASGGHGDGRLSYEVPVGPAMAGAPLTLHLLYRTGGEEPFRLAAADERGESLQEIAVLPAAPELTHYTVSFQVPQHVSGGRLRLRLYAPVAAGRAASHAVLEVEALSASYGDAVSREFTDRL